MCTIVTIKSVTCVVNFFRGFGLPSYSSMTVGHSNGKSLMVTKYGANKIVGLLWGSDQFSGAIYKGQD